MQFDGISPWIRLESELLNDLTTGQTLVHLRRKQPIFYQGDTPKSVYVVKEGRICITTYSQTGTEQQLYIAEQGALFGEHSCLLNIPHMTSAFSIVDSSVYAISLPIFYERLRESAQLNQAVMQILCRKNSLLVSRLLAQSASDALQRISQVLLDMTQEYGIENEEGIEISIRFSHQDVANLLHISRVTVTKAFQFLAREGIVARKQNRIILLDVQRLSKLAAGT